LGFEDNTNNLWENLRLSEIPKPAANRIQELYQNGSMMNILPGDYLLIPSADLFYILAILILATICILFAPVITRDTMTGIQSLQYSSKTGRKALRIQFFAMITAGLIISLVETSIIFAVYLSGIWGNFWDSGLHSFMSSHSSFFWLNGTFGQWLLLSAGLVIGVSISAIMFVFFLSKKATNYITSLFGLIPVFVVLVIIYRKIFNMPFGIIANGPTPLYELIPIPFIEFYACAALLLIGGVLACLVLHKQKKLEIV
jgi:hypothetical protein